MASRTVGKGSPWASTGIHEGHGFRVDTYTVDFDYAATMGARVVAGRDFSREHARDQEESLLVNETLLRRIGLTSPPLGERLPVLAVQPRFNKAVIGVLEDAHILSLRQAVDAAVYTLKKGNGSLQYVLLRVRAEEARRVTADLRALWNSLAPDKPFEMPIMDEDVDAQYRAEKRWGWILRWGALLGLVVAGIGAVGLTSLTLAQRRREMGIRKALGASTPRIVGLVTKQYAVLGTAANAVALPLAYAALDRWLRSFAYRVDAVGPSFVAGGAAVVLVVVGAVSLKGVAAARESPVEALRSE